MKASRLLYVIAMGLSAVVLCGCQTTHLPLYFYGTWGMCHRHEGKEEHFPADGKFSFVQRTPGSSVYQIILEGGTWVDEGNLKDADFRVYPRQGKVEEAKAPGSPPDCLKPLQASKVAVRENEPSVGATTGWQPTRKTIRLETKVCMKSEHPHGKCGPGEGMHVVKVYVTPGKDSTGADRRLITIDYCSLKEGKKGFCDLSRLRIERRSDDMGIRTPHPGHVHGDD